ncbi:MAG: hypothetical protein WC709_00960, partial [Thermoleophilia bacterium]
MTRRAWIVIIVSVAVAATAAVVGIVAIASGHESVAAAGPRATLEQLDGPGGMFGYGDRLGSGPLVGRVGDDGWLAVFGLPWLAAGLLIGLGTSLLAWQPWKRPRAAAAAMAAAPIAGAPLADVTTPAEPWAQWHRDAHAAETRAERPPAAAEASAAAPLETPAPTLPSLEAASTGAPTEPGSPADAAAPGDGEPA